MRLFECITILKKFQRGTSLIDWMNLASLSEVSLARILGNEHLSIIERSFSTKVQKNKIGEIGSLLPTVKTGCLHSLRKPTDKALLTNLKLAVHDREQILTSDLSSVDPKMAGYLIMQSCCCVFVNPVNYFSMNWTNMIYIMTKFPFHTLINSWLHYRIILAALHSKILFKHFNSSLSNL